MTQTHKKARRSPDSIMLEEVFTGVYTKFKMHFYRQVFKRFENREATLTTVETFCMESIAALGCPTVAEFSAFMNISTPNAAYKISSLVQKGYLEKVRSDEDKREYRLYPTKKYFDYFNISYNYVKTVMNRIEERFSADDINKLEEMLCIINDELMADATMNDR